MRGGQYLIFHRYIKIRIPDDVSIAGGRDSGYKTDVDFYNSEEDEWTTVGHMSTARGFHAISLVPKETADYCV